MNAKFRSSAVVLFLLCQLGTAALARAELPDFREIVREASPAVVKIIVEQTASKAEQGQRGSQEIPEELRRFLNSGAVLHRSNHVWVWGQGSLSPKTVTL